MLVINAIITESESLLSSERKSKIKEIIINKINAINDKTAILIIFFAENFVSKKRSLTLGRSLFLLLNTKIITNDINEKNIALQKVIASVNRNTHIVQQLLTMSKLVPDQAFSHDLDSVDLIKITREILAMLAPSAIEKQIELAFEPSQNVTNFPGTPTAISILIRNLVDNAIRYTETQGHIIVRVYQQQTNVILEVQDNGPGIPEQFRARVFERFFRELGKKSTGSGLGLAIVQQIASLHHAEIRLDTPSSGTGLVVRVFFHLKTRLPSESIKKRDKS